MKYLRTFVPNYLAGSQGSLAQRQKSVRMPTPVPMRCLIPVVGVGAGDGDGDCRAHNASARDAASLCCVRLSWFCP